MADVYLTTQDFKYSGMAEEIIALKAELARVKEERDEAFDCLMAIGTHAEYFVRLASCKDQIPEELHRWLKTEIHSKWMPKAFEPDWDGYSYGTPGNMETVEFVKPGGPRGK